MFDNVGMGVEDIVEGKPSCVAIVNDSLRAHELASSAAAPGAPPSPTRAALGQCGHARGRHLACDIRTAELWPRAAAHLLLTFTRVSVVIVCDAP